MTPFTGSLTASTLSTTTTYDLPSPHSTPRSSRITSDYDDNDDEIVWNISSEGSVLEGADKDFVVLARSRSDLLTSVRVKNELEQQTPVSAAKSLETQMSTLSLGSKAAPKKPKKSKRPKKITASSGQDTTTNQQQNSGKSPAESPKHADILQVLFVHIFRMNPRFIFKPGGLGNGTFRSWSTAHCR